MSNPTKPVLPEPTKIVFGDELWLTLHMAPLSLNLVVGKDRDALLKYGRSILEQGIQYGREQMREECIAELDGMKSTSHTAANAIRFCRDAIKELP